MTVIRLALTQEFQDSVSTISSGTKYIQLANINDDVDKTSVDDAMRWLADITDPVVVKAIGVKREFGDTEDPIFVEFVSDTGIIWDLDFILWLYDIDGALAKTLRTEIGVLEKSASLQAIEIPGGEMTLKQLSVVFGDKEEKTYDMSIKQRGVMEMTERNLIVTENRRRVDNKICVEMRIETQLKGGYPDIALPSDVTEGKDEVFVVLPVGAFNAESLNGHTYSQSAMTDMLNQINERRPESNWGHLSDKEIGLRYNNPPMRWLAAVEQDGVIYAKGRALTEEARTYYKRAKMDNARVGTSLFAWAELEDDTVVHMDLITIDLADPARVGVPLTAAKPEVITTEMVAKSGEEMQEEQIRKILELQEGDSIETALAAVLEAKKANETRLGELETQLEKGQKEIEEVRANNQGLIGYALEMVLASAVKLEENRPMVYRLVAGRDNEYLKQMASIDDVKNAVKEALSMPDMKALNRETLAAASGPAHVRGVDGESGEKKQRYFNIPTGEGK